MTLPRIRWAQVFYAVVFVVAATVVTLALRWFLTAPAEAKASEQLSRVVDALRPLLMVGLITGVCGMAVVQFRKNLFHVRGRYHVDHLRERFGPQWLDLAALVVGGGKGRRSGAAAIAGTAPPSDSAPAFGPSHFATAQAYAHYDQGIEIEASDLTGAPARPEAIAADPLATYEIYLQERALRAAHARTKSDRPAPDPDVELMRQWDVPTEQVVAQVARVSEFVMARPQGRVALLRRFVSPEASNLVDRYVLAVIRQSRYPTDERVDDLAFELRHHVEQQLDALLLVMKSSWTRRVRLQSVFAAGAIGFASLVFADVGPLVKLSAVIVAIVFGGVFGWLTRDLVALVEKWRS